MKTLLKLCRVIIHKNKGFTIGIFLMAILSFAIAFLGVNLGTSSNDTIDNFLTSSNTPQVIYTTKLINTDIKNQIESLDGVKEVSNEFFIDTNITTKDGKVFSVRLFSWDDNTPYKQTYHKTKKDGSKINVCITNTFAEYNDISPNDVITLNLPFTDMPLTVDATVSNPETINCVRDEMSAYENNQFAYLYVNKSLIESVLSFDGLSNRWLIYFDDLSQEEEKTCMEEIRSLFSTDMISEIFVMESEALNSLKDDLHTISIFSTFIPAVIWAISLGFGFIFIKIIIENQRKTIGLLRALGYNNGKVIWLFIFYTVLINIPAFLVGSVTGYLLLGLCTKIIASATGIINITISIRHIETVLTIIAIFVLWALSALLSSRTITKIDPCEAYGGFNSTSEEPPKTVKYLRANAFVKISVGSILRKKKRQIIGALCITACIISICIGLEGTFTLGHPINAIYGERYHYDLMVRSIDETSYQKIRSSIEEVNIVEPFTYFTSNLNGETIKISTVSEDAKLTTPYDASGKKLSPLNGVIVDEMRAKLNGWSIGDTIILENTPLTITGIAREILYTVFYVSPETAVKMGHSETNGTMITLKQNSNLESVKNKISKIAPDAYFASLSSQKENITDKFMAMRTVMGIFAVIAFLIGSLLIINLAIIDFNENVSKYATLRALGTSVKRLSIIPLIQNLIRIITGIIIALPLSYLLTSILLELISGVSQQYVMVKFATCLSVSCLVPLLYIILGTFVTMIKLRKLNFCNRLNEME